MKTIVITGCGTKSSLGYLIAKELRSQFDNCRITGVDKQWEDFPEDQNVFYDKVVIDLSKTTSPLLAGNLPGRCDILINCAGKNEIAWLEELEEEDYDDIMGSNARSILTTTKALLRALTYSEGTVLNIISNASHMPMTCSLAYNASKGAAHIMTLQLARELTKKNCITVFGISPNKLAGTGMSDYIDKRVVTTRGWSIEKAREYQLKGLVTGEETDPIQLAKFIGYLLQDKNHHKYLSGCILPYGA